MEFQIICGNVSFKNESFAFVAGFGNTGVTRPFGTGAAISLNDGYMTTILINSVNDFFRVAMQ